MEISDLMGVLGGVATRHTLVRLTSRRDLEEALAAGQIIRVNRGRYAVPGVHEGTTQALKVSGHACLITAALSYGWEVKEVPDLPQVAVPKDRRLPGATRALIEPIWIDLGHEDVEGLCTTETKTLEMCGRRLPFDEALTIADSALRRGFPRSELVRLAGDAKGPGSARLRRSRHWPTPRRQPVRVSAACHRARRVRAHRGATGTDSGRARPRRTT